MATPSRVTTEHKSVNLLRQKFEKSKDVAERPATGGSAPNSPQLCLPGRFGVAKKIGQISGDRNPAILRRSSASGLVNRSKDSPPWKGATGPAGKSTAKPQKESPLTGRYNGQLSKNAEKTPKKQSVVKGIECQVKPSLPVKPKSLMVTKLGNSFQNLVETQPIRHEKSNAKHDPETGSPTPDEGNLPSIVERARLFSAEEPRAGVSRQRKHSPIDTNALTAKAWEESGDQGNEEDNLSEKLTPHSVHRNANRKKRLFLGNSGNQRDIESSTQPLRSKKKKSIKNQQGQETSLPSTGLQKIIPRWFWKSRFKSMGQKDAKTATQCPGSLLMETSEAPENTEEDSVPGSSQSGASTNSSKALHKVPGCEAALSHVSSHPELTKSTSKVSASHTVLDEAKGFGSSVARSSSQRSLEVQHQVDTCASPKLLTPEMSSPSCRPSNASKANKASIESENKQECLASVFRPNEQANQHGKGPKLLPDILSKEVFFLGALPEEMSGIQELKREPLIQEYQRTSKPLPAVRKDKSGVSGMVEALNQSPQIPHRERNKSVTAIWRVTKPVPNDPIKDIPSSCRRQEVPSAKITQPVKGLIPRVSAESAELILASLLKENCASEADGQKTNGFCFQASASAERHLSQSSPSKLSKPLPEISKDCSLHMVTPNTKAQDLLAEDYQNAEGLCCLLAGDLGGSNPRNLKSLPDIPQSSFSSETLSIKKATKPVVVPRKSRRPTVMLVNGHFLNTLPKVLEEGTEEEEGMLTAPGTPKPLPRVPRQTNLNTPSLKETPGSVDPLFKNVSGNTGVSLAQSSESLSSNHLNQDTILTTNITVTEETNPQKDVEQPTLLETKVADIERGSNITSPTRKVLAAFSEYPDSDNENGSCNVWEGSDCEVQEARIIPLRPNKLLQCEFSSTTGRGDLRRTSSLEDFPVVSVSFTNARGLFQQAQLMKSCESLNTTAKPPIPNKPPVLKKPVFNSGPDGFNGKPCVPSKITISSPPRKTSKPQIALKPSEQANMDNIYDEVYHEGMEQSEVMGTRTNRQPSKKLEKILGPDFVTSKQAGSDDEKSKTTGKSKKPVLVVDLRTRKISAPARPTIVDREGPYAVIPLPDADKTATKKTKNPIEQKTREISDGNGNKVVLRNSGMSSGDSGISGLPLGSPGIKRVISKRDRRMSRRLLRQKIKSMDSDFMEDSDDEPIGADSDFDSDSSLDDEPIVFLDDIHQKAFEVLTTERTYVETLHLISEIFMRQIEEENKEKGWFNHSYINEIFSNITSIYQLHSAVLLPDLEETFKHWERNPCLGEVLKKNAPFLKLYSDYVSNFDHAMKQLKDLMSKAPKFAARLAELQKHELCGNLALQHHMLTPIQRIPRYELLLKEYLRKLPDDCKDRADTQKALGIISGAAQHSNDMMKSMDQFEKLLKINEKIDGENIIDPTRHLLKEGKLAMTTDKSKEAQERYIFLFNDILLCCEKKRLLTSSANYKVKLKMEVDGMKVMDGTDFGFVIENETATRSIEFKTSSEEEKEEWMKVLISAVTEMARKKESFRTNAAIAEKRNSSVVQDKSIPGKVEPRLIRDDETSMCMGCGTDFKLVTKRRHHCRACGAVVCYKCSNYEINLEYDVNKLNKVCYKCYYKIKGDNDELQKITSTRRSLIPDIDDDKSFGSFLYLHHKGAWAKFWVVVTEQDMFVLKAPKDVRAMLSLPIKMYSFRDLQDSDSERDHVFKLKGKDDRTVYTLSAESKEIKNRWKIVLTEGIHTVYKTMTI